MMSRRVHLVGSIGLDTVDEVFTTVGRLLGPYLKRMPDGEVGGRRMWIGWQAPLLRANPFLQLDSSSPELADFAPLCIADGVDPEEIHFVAAAPVDVEIGIHLCYGDRDGHHFIEPVDLGKAIEFATLILDRIDRPLNWLHLPVPIGRDDDVYYAPLRLLQLPYGAELYLGLVHAADGVDGTRRRIAVAERFAPEFGISAECGFARARRPDVVKQFLATHAGAAAP